MTILRNAFKTTQGQNNQLVSNWNDLKQLKKIEHNDYDINAPIEFINHLVNVNEDKELNDWREKYHKTNFCIFSFYIIATLFSMCFNGIHQFEYHFKFTFPILCCQHILFGLIKLFRIGHFGILDRMVCRLTCYILILVKCIWYLIPVILYSYINTNEIRNRSFECLYLSHIIEVIYLFINSFKHDNCLFIHNIRKQCKETIEIIYELFPKTILRILHHMLLPFSVMLKYISMNIILPFNGLFNWIVCALYAFVFPYYSIQNEKHWKNEDYSGSSYALFNIFYTYFSIYLKVKKIIKRFVNLLINILKCFGIIITIDWNDD